MTARLQEKAVGVRTTPIVVLYLALAMIGLVGTWYCNLTYTGGDYLGDWFANRASSSAAVDILITFGACAVLYVSESRRLSWPIWMPVLFTVASLAIAVAFAFPLFLAARELRLRGGAARTSPGRADKASSDEAYRIPDQPTTSRKANR